jgi:hypothetical protein
MYKKKALFGIFVSLSPYLYPQPLQLSPPNRDTHGEMSLSCNASAFR